VMGIFLTPVLLLAFVGDAGAQAGSTPDHAINDEPADDTHALLMKVFGELLVTVALPLCVGQVLRPALSQAVDNRKQELGTASSLTLLLIIYTTFCNTFCADQCDAFYSALTPDAPFEKHADPSPLGELSVLTLIVTGLCVLTMQVCFMTTVFMVVQQKCWNFTRADIVAIVFCSVHKSLTLGVPMLKVVFSDPAVIAVISLPLLMYHPIQILIGGFIGPTARTWLTSDHDHKQRHSWSLPM